MLIKSALVSMSGRIGNWVAMKTRSGTAFRTQNVVLNPNTSAQSARRAIFSNITKLWAEGVNPSQKRQFDSLGEEYPVINRLGAVVVLTGNQIFNRINFNRKTVALDPIVIAPTTQDVVSLQSPIVTMTSNPLGTVSVVWDDPSPLPSDSYLIFRAVVNLGAGRRYFKNRLRIAGISEDGATTPQTFDTGEVGLVDSYLGWGVSVINGLTGAQSVEQTGRSIVTLAP